MIDERYITLLQARRQAFWDESDAAFQARDWDHAKCAFAQAMGISAAISALQNYDFDRLTLDAMEKELAE